MGIKKDGTVVFTGENTFGKLNISDWTDITQVSVNGNHTVGLKSDGTVIAVGDNSDGECDVSEWSK